MWLYGSGLLASSNKNSGPRCSKIAGGMGHLPAIASKADLFVILIQNRTAPNVNPSPFHTFPSCNAQWRTLLRQFRPLNDVPTFYCLITRSKPVEGFNSYDANGTKWRKVTAARIAFSHRKPVHNAGALSPIFSVMVVTDF